MAAVTLDRDALAALLPHAGAMCLLDAVESYDGQRIVCTTMQHRNRHNPLAVDGRLGCVQGIEFAAQAMAIHGAQLASPAGVRPSVGWLASVRDCVLIGITTRMPGRCSIGDARRGAGGAPCTGLRSTPAPRVCAGTATVASGIVPHTRRALVTGGMRVSVPRSAVRSETRIVTCTCTRMSDLTKRAPSPRRSSRRGVTQRSSSST